MCKVGDIILVNQYKHGEKILDRHSFVVLSDESGQIEGLDYDIICNVMSSFKNEEQKQRKLSYPGNFPITYNDSDVKNNDGIDGYIKADQLYFFKKEALDFVVIGNLKEDIFELLIKFIESYSGEFQEIIDNLKQASSKK